MSITADQIPGYRAGTWNIDPTHTEVGFSVRHLAISKVKGKFERFSGTIVTGENPLDSSVEARVEVASINTNQADRDGHLRTGDFFAAEEFPEFTLKSTGIRQEGGDFKVDTELTLRGVTKPVTFDFEFGGFGADAYGNYKAGFTATAVVKREDFGIEWNAPLETGGLLLGSDVTITLDVQAAFAQE
ncbi:YceI family protein [Leucobacter weissii]|uniref:YceI family protein n=1 Tax=Leucobacter weissii TaxID=1983706 RepID=A0A939MLD6_9MICO|nr:YceI family protein [Leucobacter weissii]MBO1902903.1 YceI family protein [Leucobacter weissii]